MSNREQTESNGIGAASDKRRCSWVSADEPPLLEYHDDAWVGGGNIRIGR